MFKHILLAYDGSEHARKAAEFAGDLARSQTRAVVRVVTVQDVVPADLGAPVYDRWLASRAEAGQTLLAEAARLVGEGVDVHTELLFGSTAEEIIRVTEVRGCDLILMGSRGLGALAGLLLGSNTQKVISHAKCPVLVVR